MTLQPDASGHGHLKVDVKSTEQRRCSLGKGLKLIHKNASRYLNALVEESLKESPKGCHAHASFTCLGISSRF